MLERYSTQEMRDLWSLENKFQNWLNIELAACEYWHQQGKINNEDWKVIKEKSRFTVNRILEIESEVHHDVIAFLTSVAENVGEASRFIHFGLTSSDVVDTGLSYTLKQAGSIIISQCEKFLKTLHTQSLQYKDVIIAGRTHGVHAEPTTLGLKLLGYYEESKRNLHRFKMAIEEISYGKISGAVGTYSQLPPELEAFVMKQLGLKVEPVSTQVVPRDRHANLLNTMALMAQGLSRLAQEIRLLQKTESREIEEPFQTGQKGSSAMPHKRNPILCERISGLARTITGYAQTSMQNILLWHERDISHSSAERVILPDGFTLLEYMLIKMNFVIGNFHVYPNNCNKVLETTKGLIFSSRALLMITEELKITREEAYQLVQKYAMDIWNSNDDKLNLKTALMNEPKLKKIPNEIWERTFDTADFIKNIDIIYKRCK